MGKLDADLMMTTSIQLDFYKILRDLLIVQAGQFGIRSIFFTDTREICTFVFDKIIFKSTLGRRKLTVNCGKIVFPESLGGKLFV